MTDQQKPTTPAEESQEETTRPPKGRGRQHKSRQSRSNNNTTIDVSSSGEATVTETAGDKTDATDHQKTADAATVGNVTRTTATPPSSPSTSSTGNDRVSQSTPKSAPQDSSISTAEPTPAKTAKGPLWLAIILALGGVSLGGYAVWQQYQLKQQSAASEHNLDSRLSALQSSQSSGLDSLKASLSADIQQATAQTKSTTDAMQQVEERVDKGLQQMRALTSTSRSDWDLAEVEYLLRLANQRIMTEKNAAGALAMLKSADTILRDLDDVSAYPVRKAVAEDLARLEAVPKLDTEGLFLRLAALNEQVNHLDLLPVTEQKVLPDVLKEVTDEQTAASWSESLGKAWDTAWHKLNELVVIHRRDGEVQPLLSPQEHFYLQQNLHLMLEQAQLALLQGKQQAYDSSLQKAEQWLPRYFDKRQSSTQALIDGIKELQTVKVSPELPDISTSLNVLKQYLQSIHSKDGKAQPAASTGGEG